MTPQDYARLRGLFDAAMALEPRLRSAYVDEQMGEDDPLRADLVAMVESGDDSRLMTIEPPPLPGRAQAGEPVDVQISNYRILREIARGGMGVVYQAVRSDDVFHKVVAVKVIGGSAAEKAEFVARFRRERQILAGLDHPNIARILDGGNTADGRPFYVMEYIAGSPIDEYCAKIAADATMRVRMVIEVCEAIDYLHNHAITHRDIKPSNILVTADGRVKVVDFGIAKLDTIDGLVTSHSEAGQVTMIMTPGYASPEQIDGEGSGRSGDIYSLGVVLYQLLAGRLPFVGDDGRPNLTAQLQGATPTPPSKEMRDGASRHLKPSDFSRISIPDLDRVVLTALQRDPARRYAGVQIFAEDLRRCLDGRPITAHAENPTYRLRRLVARNRLSTALAAALVLTTVFGGWTAVSWRIERVRLEAREDELGRFVAMMDGRVLRWQRSTEQVPTEEKVADVHQASELMSSETVRILSARAPDPDRVKKLVEALRGVLDRAESLSAQIVPLRKEIAVVYRQIGDFQAKAPETRIADAGQAQTSYRRAVSVAVSLRQAEPSWVAGELEALDGRLKGLGATLDLAEVSAASVPTPPVIAPSPPQVRAASPAAPVAVRPAAAVDPEALAEVEQRMRSVATSAQVAHRNLEALQVSLAGSGQTVRADLITAMGRVDDLLSDARSAINAHDLDEATDTLGRATYELRRLLQAIGG